MQNGTSARPPDRRSGTRPSDTRDAVLGRCVWDAEGGHGLPCPAARVSALTPRSFRSAEATSSERPQRNTYVPLGRGVAGGALVRAEPPAGRVVLGDGGGAPRVRR